MAQAMTETRRALQLEHEKKTFEGKRNENATLHFRERTKGRKKPTVERNKTRFISTLTKMLKFFIVVVVATVALFGCSTQAIDLSRLYGLHNKREGNMMGEWMYF